MREPESYFMWEQFLCFFIDFALPIGLALGGLYIWYLVAGFNLLDYFLQNPNMLLFAVVVASALLIMLILLVPPIIKCLMFGRCDLCGGSGKGSLSKNQGV